MTGLSTENASDTFQDRRLGTITANVDIGAAWLRQFGRLEGLRALPDGWDGDAARAPEDGLIFNAGRLLNDLYRKDCLPPSRISAMPSGSVVIEWHNHGAYHEMELEAPDRVEYMFKPVDGPAEHAEFLIGNLGMGAEYSTLEVGLRATVEIGSTSTRYARR